MRTPLLVVVSICALVACMTIVACSSRSATVSGDAAAGSQVDSVVAQDDASPENSHPDETRIGDSEPEPQEKESQLVCDDVNLAAVRVGHVDVLRFRLTDGIQDGYPLFKVQNASALEFVEVYWPEEPDSSIHVRWHKSGLHVLPVEVWIDGELHLVEELPVSVDEPITFLGVPLSRAFAIDLHFVVAPGESTRTTITQAWSDTAARLNQDSRFNLSRPHASESKAECPWQLLESFDEERAQTAADWIEECLAGDRSSLVPLWTHLVTTLQVYPSDLESLVLVIPENFTEAYERDPQSDSEQALLKDLPAWLSKFETLELTVVYLGTKRSEIKYLKELVELAAGELHTPEADLLAPSWDAENRTWTIRQPLEQLLKDEGTDELVRLVSVVFTKEGDPLGIQVRAEATEDCFWLRFGWKKWDIITALNGERVLSMSGIRRRIRLDENKGETEFKFTYERDGLPNELTFLVAVQD